MLNRRNVLALLCLLPLAIAGCNIETINSFPVKPAHVRVMNAIPNAAAAIDVSVDGGVKWPALAFESITSFQDFSNETHTFSATVGGAITTLTQANFNLAGEGFYTLVLFGPVEAPSLALLADDTVTPTSGRFLLRLANLAAGAAVLDLYLTAPGDDINAASPNLTSIVYGTSTGFLQLSSGTLQLRLTQSGTKSVIYDSGARTWPDNTATDAIAYTRNGGQLVNLAVADINGAGQSVIVNSTLAQYKIVNAAFDTGAINAFLDGAATLVTNLAYPTASTYNIVPPGAHAFGIEATVTPGATIASLNTTLDAATDTSILVTGFAGSLLAVPLHDFNVQSASGNSRLRIVNASPDAPPLDVVINGTRQVSGLAYANASGYLSLGANTYTIAFNNAAGVTLYTASGVALSGSQISTLYVVGPASQMSNILVRDN